MTTDPLAVRDGPLIFISAAEPSADLYGASLIHAVERLSPGARFVGVAGPAMRDAGCWAFQDMSRRSAMLASAFANISDALRALGSTRRHLARYPFAAAVFIDSPMLNLPLAKAAKARGVPVLYYIAPQAWAWGRYRVRRIRRRVDKLAVIFPFEEQFFREHRIDATYVGHPLLDDLAARRPIPELRQAIRQSGGPIVTVLPGSRKHVVETVLPGQLEVARKIADRHPRAFFPISVANDSVRRSIERCLADCGVRYALHHGKNADLIESADLLLVASGTSTLEVAYYHKPMIVMYNGSRLGYHLVGRWLLHIPHLSLVNILAGRRLVPEFMPYYKSTDPIARCALELLDSPAERETMSRELAALIDAMLRPGAPANTAAILLSMLRPPSEAGGPS